MKIVGCLESFLLGFKNSLYSGNIYVLKTGIVLMIGETTKTGYFAYKVYNFLRQIFQLEIDYEKVMLEKNADTGQ